MKDDEDILDDLGEVAAVNTDEFEKDLWQQVSTVKYTNSSVLKAPVRESATDLVYMQAEEATGSKTDKGIATTCSE